MPTLLSLVAPQLVVETTYEATTDDKICIMSALIFQCYPDSKVHRANMGPTWVLSAPVWPHVGPMNLAIRVNIYTPLLVLHLVHRINTAVEYAFFILVFEVLISGNLYWDTRQQTTSFDSCVYRSIYLCIASQVLHRAMSCILPS